MNRAWLKAVQRVGLMVEREWSSYARKLLRPVMFSVFGCLGIGMMVGQDTLPIVKVPHFISRENQSFLSSIANNTRFGSDVAGLGDIDGDGVVDMAVGQQANSNGTGAVWLLMLNDTGGVKAHVFIASDTSGFGVTLDAGDNFGGRIANMGDLDGDGVTDLAVMATGDDDGGTDRGAVYILFLDTVNTEVQVKAYQKISDTAGSFGGDMSNGRAFAGALAEVGDLNGDGIQDLAVGAYLSNDGGTERGALWLLFLDTDGTVQGFKRISHTSVTWPGGSPINVNSAQLGFSAAKLGDLDGDGYNDIAVTARMQGGNGYIYVLFLDTTLISSTPDIKAYDRIEPADMQTAVSNNGGHFGWSLHGVGDLNGDGNNDLLASARLQTDGYTYAGAVYVIYLNSDGTVQHDDYISETEGLESGSLGLHASAYFGFGVGYLGDLNGDGMPDIAVTASAHNGGGTERGRVYLLELNPKPLVTTYGHVNETDTTPGSISVSIVGGQQPYMLLNGIPFPSSSEYETMVDGIDTTGFYALGLPGEAMKELNYDEFVANSQIDTDSLAAGIYRITLMDARGERVFLSIPVGHTIEAQTSTGVSFTGGSDLVRTAATGGSMEFTTKNVLAPDGIGWISFEIPQHDSVIAVGMRKIDTTAVNGFEQMEFAMFFNGDTVRYYYDGSLHGSGLPILLSDRFGIEVSADSVFFLKNDTLLHTALRGQQEKALILDAFIAKLGGQVAAVNTAMRGMAVQAVVTHNRCWADPDQGSIDLTVYPLTGTYSFSWSEAGSAFSSSAEDITQLSNGIYTVVITNGAGSTVTRTYRVGYEVIWNERIFSHTDVNESNTLIKDSPTPPSTDGLGLSSNRYRLATDSWVQFRPHGPLLGGYVVACGLYDYVLGQWTAGLQMSNPGWPNMAFSTMSVGGLAQFYSFGAGVSAPIVAIDVQPGSGGGSNTITAVASTSLGSLPVPISTITFNGSLDHQKLFGVILQDGRRLERVVTSMDCGSPQYALMEPDLTDRIHRAFEGRLDFIHVEDYNSTQLDYVVTDLLGNVVVDATTQPISVAYGYNPRTINLVIGGNELDSGIYLLQVTDQKGLKRYLRFEYTATAP